MAALPKEKPIIRFSVDEMEAYMLLPSPDEGEEYTVPYVMQALSERGTHGSGRSIRERSSDCQGGTAG